MSRYAIIINEKVDNVIVADPHNASKIATAKNGIAVYAEHYPIQPNDDYIDNQFVRDGKVIERMPTQEELIAKHNQIIDDLIIADLNNTEVIDDLILESLGGI